LKEAVAFNVTVSPSVDSYPKIYINSLNVDLNPICHLLALLGAHHILHVSRIRAKPGLTLKKINLFEHPFNVPPGLTFKSYHSADRIP
jgi:hypothetical protein